MSRSLKAPYLIALSLLPYLFAQSVCAQSLDLKHPAELKEGANNATIDSFGGEQFWYFNAKPGKFKAVFARSATQEGFAVNAAKASAGAVINPAVQGSTISEKDTPSGKIFEGSCEKPSRILIMVEPAKSPLVRQTNSYSISVEGSSAAAAEASAANDSVAGTYDVNLNSYGAAKLNSDGSIVTTSGASGKWTLFDNDTRTYIIKLGNDSWTLTFQPARGFIDKNGTLILSTKKNPR